jgi:hypothetical protein
MLDAKEHIFLTVAPLYALYIFINEIFFSKGKSIWRKIKKIIYKNFIAYLPSVVWIVLMFTTSIIPVNMFVASISGLIDTGMSWNKSQFSAEVATQNLLEDETAKSMPSLKKIDNLGEYCNIENPNNSNPNDLELKINNNSLICKFINKGDVVLGYVGKMLYPRTFSFISIPKIIVLPAIVFSISMLITWFKKKDKRIILPMILLFNVFVLMIRASHGRYLLCVAPLFALFFVMFLEEGIKREKYFRNILIATTVFVALGLYFESSFILAKIILEGGLLTLFWCLWFVRKNQKLFTSLKELFLLGLVSGMFATNLVFSYSIGQISNYLKYGYNRETAKMVEYLPKEENVWINNYGSRSLIQFYRGDLYTNPEWKWHLSSWIPKKDLLKVYAESNTHTFPISYIDRFKEQIEELEIETVVMVVSTIEDEKFTDQDKLSDLISQEWLELEEAIELKNKKMYIFQVNE